MTKEFSPSCGRNKVVIGEALDGVLPKSSARVLEIASGTGEHCAHFAERFPHLNFHPTDAGDSLFDSIRAHNEPFENVAAPQLLDVTHDDWPLSEADIIFNANMIHIAPPEVTTGLLEGANRVLSPRGRLVLYGPFKRDGAHTSQSNIDFDVWLKNRDPRFGVRDLEAVAIEAAKNTLSISEIVAMPANNFLLVFEKDD